MRDSMVKNWLNGLTNENIPCSDVFDMPGILTDPMTIQDWNICGFPSDSVSICNAIIINRSKR